MGKPPGKGAWPQVAIMKPLLEPVFKRLVAQNRTLAGRLLFGQKMAPPQKEHMKLARTILPALKVTRQHPLMLGRSGRLSHVAGTMLTPLAGKVPVLPETKNPLWLLALPQTAKQHPRRQMTTWVGRHQTCSRSRPMAGKIPPTNQTQSLTSKRQGRDPPQQVTGRTVDLNLMLKMLQKLGKLHRIPNLA